MTDAKTPDRCEHFDAIARVEARTDGCEECLALGVAWNELRMCLVCGHVGCCEDSEYAHALAHFNATGHALIASRERGESWIWCYVHRRYFDAAPGEIPKKPSAIGALFRRLRKQ